MFNWRCPTCGHATTITDPNATHKSVDLFCETTPDDKGVQVVCVLIECPNDECRAQFFKVRASHGPIVRPAHGADHVSRNQEELTPIGIGEFTFLPTTAQPLSAHVPKTVAEDYNEAYLISALSPKAAATLARRALQGMIRDFWGVRGKGTLQAELRAIEDKCAPELYDAMLGMKSIGNIGAHPERDVNLIVDVEPGEPEALLDLLHLLDREWYVARADHQKRIQRVRDLAAAKNGS